LRQKAERKGRRQKVDGRTYKGRRKRNLKERSVEGVKRPGRAAALPGKGECVAA
jgi:hypothetical protein